jgi:hypothetical protein
LQSLSNITWPHNVCTASPCPNSCCWHETPSNVWYRMWITRFVMLQLSYLEHPT